MFKFVCYWKLKEFLFLAQTIIFRDFGVCIDQYAIIEMNSWLHFEDFEDTETQKYDLVTFLLLFSLPLFLSPSPSPCVSVSPFILSAYLSAFLFTCVCMPLSAIFLNLIQIKRQCLQRAKKALSTIT